MKALLVRGLGRAFLCLPVCREPRPRSECRLALRGDKQQLGAALLARIVGAEQRPLLALQRARLRQRREEVLEAEAARRSAYQVRNAARCRQLNDGRRQRGRRLLVID
eukprot:scaffold57080_cov63-Phaeocystis_antarctica.AAC.5